MPFSNSQFFANDPAWLHARAGKIGASSLATIAGAPGAFLTPYALALEIRGEAPEREQTRSMRRGSHLEAGVVSWWAEEQGIEVIRLAGRLMISDPSAPLVATLDAYQVVDGGPSAIVEAKTVHFMQRDDWGEDGDAAGVPLRVQVQVQAQMALVGLARGYVVAYFGGDDLRSYSVEFNPDFWSRLRAAAIDFHARVLAGWTPDPTAADLGLMRDRWPLDTGATVDLAPELSDQAAIFEAAKEELTPIMKQVKLIEGRRDDAKARIITAIGDAAVGVLADGGRYEYRTTERKGFEVKPTTLRTLRRK